MQPRKGFKFLADWWRNLEQANLSYDERVEMLESNIAIMRKHGRSVQEIARLFKVTDRAIQYHCKTIPVYPPQASERPLDFFQDADLLSLFLPELRRNDHTAIRTKN